MSIPLVAQQETASEVCEYLQSTCKKSPGLHQRLQTNYFKERFETLSGNVKGIIAFVAD